MACNKCESGDGNGAYGGPEILDAAGMQMEGPAGGAWVPPWPSLNGGGVGPLGLLGGRGEPPGEFGHDLIGGDPRYGSGPGLLEGESPYTGQLSGYERSGDSDYDREEVEAFPSLPMDGSADIMWTPPWQSVSSGEISNGTGEYVECNKKTIKIWPFTPTATESRWGYGKTGADAEKAAKAAAEAAATKKLMDSVKDMLGTTTVKDVPGFDCKGRCTRVWKSPISKRTYTDTWALCRDHRKLWITKPLSCTSTVTSVQGPSYWMLGQDIVLPPFPWSTREYKATASATCEITLEGYYFCKCASLNLYGPK